MVKVPTFKIGREDVLPYPPSKSSSDGLVLPETPFGSLPLATASDQSVSPSCRDRICRTRTTVALGQVGARRRAGAPTSTGAVSCASTRHNTGCPSWMQIDTE